MSDQRCWIRVALDVPVAPWFDYEWPPRTPTNEGDREAASTGDDRPTPEPAPSASLATRQHAGAPALPPPPPGTWLVVPWGRQRRIGLMLGVLSEPGTDPQRIRPALSVVDQAPAADPAWLSLGQFAARYYHRPIGEILLTAIPKLLRVLPGPRSRGNAFERARQIGRARSGVAPATGSRASPACSQSASPGATEAPRSTAPVLTAAQRQVLTDLDTGPGFAVHLLFGITGSGKTEVYLHWIARQLAEPGAQVLLMVPEIGLTDQLVRRLQSRFPEQALAILHSDLPDGVRARHWLAAADGRARLIVGTRLAILTPMPGLRAIVIDEEHDPSYRQQEGVRYSARDLAIALASQRGLPILLGSATPSLETWRAAQTGRYQLHRLAERPPGAVLPALKIVAVKADPRRPGRRPSPDVIPSTSPGPSPSPPASPAARPEQADHGLGTEAIAAIEAALSRGDQALVFLNRRGFAPVLHCAACQWFSQCPACSAFRVVHRLGGGPAERNAPPRYRLVCHHCGADAPVPRACPDCGQLDLQAVGRGTQRLESALVERFPAARIARLDRDVARHRGATQRVLDAAHAGEVDILVGTQMLAKGHDFERLSVVVVIDADGGLYAADFRAPERLFATLMQVAGRAGRSARSGVGSEVIVQTRFADHPLFGALQKRDYEGFAALQLMEREQAGLPPFMFQALLKVEARDFEDAVRWLQTARSHAIELAGEHEPGTGAASDIGSRSRPRVSVYDPVPMSLRRLADTERAQLLIESPSRKALHALIDEWLPRLREPSPNLRVLRWQLELDPPEI